MRNLKLLYSCAIKDEILESATAFCVNTDSEIIYFASNDELHCLDMETKEVTTRTLTWEINKEKWEIIKMDYITQSQSLCITFSTGDIFLYNINEKKVDCVGCVEFGLLAASWSPDQDLFVLITGSGTFILMSRHFYAITEKALRPVDFGESMPVTVGWGSKETQFHGSVGKEAAKVKPEESAEIFPWDDCKPRISWRHDGVYFVTSIADVDKACRKLRIWNREGILQYTSEIKGGLEQPICWRPSGCLIACTRQQPNKHEVVFFEKNGLQHGGFTLPYPPKSFVVKEVLWNRSSSILAIWGHEMDKAKFSVTLWTVRNYRWYLKQNLEFDYDPKFEIKDVLWDKFNLYKLHIFCSNGQYYQYNWAWTIYHSLGTVEEDNVSITVIDNGEILVTPFKKMIVPPPMCSYSFACPASVNSVAFSPSPRSEDFCLILSNHQIAFFSKVAPVNAIPLPEGCKCTLQAAGGNGFRSMVNPHFYLGCYSVNWDKLPGLEQYPLFLCHWTWVSQNKLLCIGYQGNTVSSVLLTVSLPERTGSSTLELEGDIFAQIDETVIGISSSEDGNVAAIQLLSGRILKYSLGEISAWRHLGEELYLPSPSVQFSACTINGEVVVLSLSDRFCLYSNKTILVSQCTSYCCSGDFLFVTNSDHYLKCYSLKAVLALTLDIHPVKFVDLDSQQCERGSKILTSVPGDTKLILQVPRGNLEVVHPRPLVVSTVSKHLNGSQYRKAFDVAKVHRVNLNILYDHNPEVFMNSVDTFVEQMDSPSDLNLFLVSLENGNISQKLYSFHSFPENVNEKYFSTKCDLICDAVRKAIETKGVERYFETLIATYSQKTNAELDAALIKIKEMKGLVQEENSTSIAEKALKFLLFLVDVDKLYKVALGTYDFELAVMVAEKSNMDPMEYLPFLNNLQQLEDNYRKYKVDMHLERYKKALQNISKCEGHFEECLSLIKSQRLYTASLHLFPQSSVRFKAVWSEYGDYLMGKKYFKEAGLAYCKGENHEKCLKAYQESGDWQLALCAARNLQYSKEKTALLCQSLAMKLKEEQKYEEAALLLEQYAEEIEHSVVTLIDGQMWDAALNSMDKHNRLDMTATHLRPALLEQYQHLLSFLSQMETDFCRHFERLKVVREKKDNCTSERTYNGLFSSYDGDLFSETGSVMSMSSCSRASKQLSGSLVTRKSSRSRRKQELKKFRLKEGSPNEDLALMRELSEIVSKVDKARDNFFSFLRMLVQFDLENEAKEIQQKMKQIITTIETEMPNIWTSMKPGADVKFGPDFTSNAIAEFVEMQKKTIRNLSDPSFTPPKWETKDIFLQLLD